MATRFFIGLSFQGTRYHGWQIQQNATSVQGMLESCLQKITGEAVSTTGAGRTDTGVHARNYTAHFESDHPLFRDENCFLYRINAILPTDIAVQHIYEVVPEAHARFSALSRTYEYTITLRKDPFMTDFAWCYTRKLNVTAMNEAAALLKNHNDFASFSKLHSDVKTTCCNLIRAGWVSKGHLLIFTIEADRFLRNMVRAVVGTLILVGTDRISVADFNRIIEGKDRSKAGFSAPAQGLALVDIRYPESVTK